MKTLKRAGPGRPNGSRGPEMRKIMLTLPVELADWLNQKAHQHGGITVQETIRQFLGGWYKSDMEKVSEVPEP